MGSHESSVKHGAKVPTRYALALFVATACVFALLGSREPPAGDSRVMYLTGESLALRGELSIKWLWPPMSKRGPDGKIYGQFAPLPPLLAVPTVWVREAIPSTPANAYSLLNITSHLQSHVAAGALALVFFLLCLDLGAARRRAFLWTAILMFATTCAVYARVVYSEIWQATFVVMVLREALRFRADPSMRQTLRLGLAASLLVLTKLVYLLSIGPAFLLLLVRATPEVRVRRFPVLVAILAGAGAVYAGFNLARWGSLTDTGYGETLGQLGNLPIVGLYGILFSAGKSILLFSPPMVLGFVAAPEFWRRHRDAALLVAALVVGPMLLAACLLSWPGDYAWGTRYMVFATPLFLLPVAIVGEFPRWLTRSLVGFGVVIQLLGASFYFTQYVWLSHVTRAEWLGEPNRSGSSFKLRDHNTHCGACYEDMHAQRFLPEFSQLLGHWWLLKSKALGRTWDEAQAAAPWSPNTTVTLRRGRTLYDETRLDWWLLESPLHIPATLAILVLAVLGLWWSARVLRRE
ncbi:MAG: hypothetical protein SFX73_31485 [Kofleriaceae bacterium]|nr:hypothetical protein [Kofleriaceae bacterium]